MANDLKNAAKAAAGGAAVGAVTSATVGGAGVVVAGSAVGLGLLAFTGIGLVAGVAGYGLWRAFKK